MSRARFTFYLQSFEKKIVIILFTDRFHNIYQNSELTYKETKYLKVRKKINAVAVRKKLKCWSLVVSADKRNVSWTMDASADRHTCFTEC